MHIEQTSRLNRRTDKRLLKVIISLRNSIDLQQVNSLADLPSIINGYTLYLEVGHLIILSQKKSDIKYTLRMFQRLMGGLMPLIKCCTLRTVVLRPVITRSSADADKPARHV